MRMEKILFSMVGKRETKTTGIAVCSQRTERIKASLAAPISQYIHHWEDHNRRYPGVFGGIENMKRVLF